MLTTKISLQDKLPLTCSRRGTCCHGNVVYLNPWELATISLEKKISKQQFVHLYCDNLGIQLRFDGLADLRGKKACAQYIENFGCSVHEKRPLACRLFPLGRQIQNSEVQYIFQGSTFPCLDGCNEVLNLPQIKVENYLKEQQVMDFELAQDEYLEVMQNLADVAFMLLLETDLAFSKVDVLSDWKKISDESIEMLANGITSDWKNALIFPEILETDPKLFIHLHNEMLQQKAQDQFGVLTAIKELQHACCLMLRLALILATSLGANTKSLCEHWIEIAENQVE